MSECQFLLEFFFIDLFSFTLVVVGFIQQSFVICCSLGYFEDVIGHLQRFLIPESRHYSVLRYSSADLGTLQHISVPCSRLGYSSADIGILQQTWVLFSRHLYSAAVFVVMQQLSLMQSLVFASDIGLGTNLRYSNRLLYSDFCDHDTLQPYHLSEIYVFWYCLHSTTCVSTLYLHRRQIISIIFIPSKGICNAQRVIFRVVLMFAVIANYIHTLKYNLDLSR